MSGRYQTTYSSTPASLIYAQSWPVPSSNTSFGKRYGETLMQSQRRNANLADENKRKSPYRYSINPNEKSHSWAKSMLNNNYPDWVEDDAHMKLDMANEFKLTLRMFKKLTQQVHNASEQIKTNKKSYSFKHYFSNRQLPTTTGQYYQSPYASQKPQIPPKAFNTCQETIGKASHQSQLPETRKTIVYQNSTSSKENSNSPVISDKVEVLATGVDQFNVNKPKLTINDNQIPINDHLLHDVVDDDQGDVDYSPGNDQIGLGYIDPVPRNWNELKLEEIDEGFLVLENSSKPDPFLLRYFELRRLEAETIDNEKYPGRNDENIDNNSSKNTNINGNKTQTKKATDQWRVPMPRPKVERLSKTPEISRKLNTFRCETPSSKQDIKKFEKITETKVNKVEKESRKTKGLSARSRKTNNPNKIQSSCSFSTLHYDIVDIAQTFDPPCKGRIEDKPRPVTAKSAKSKGLLPGKSCHSQRWFSLTNDQTNVTIKQSVKTSRTSRSKSAKRGARRCASSKQ